MLPEIHIIGTPSSGLFRLSEAIIAHPNPVNTDAVSKATQHDAPKTWTIDNKYYNAETQLCCIQLGEEQQSNADSICTSPEALVLAVSAIDQSSLKSVQNWNDSHSSDDVGVKLLVVTQVENIIPTADQATSIQVVRPDWLVECIDWCAENQYEYVEVCCSNQDLDKKLEDDGEPQGVARVVDALHAHMWPGLTRKHPNSQQESQQQQCSSLKHADTVENDQDAMQHPVQTELKSQQNECKNVKSDEAQEEFAMDQFEKLMEEMAAAKAQLSGLDDDARRARAAELALRFAAMLGNDEEDEDEGEW